MPKFLTTNFYYLAALACIAAGCSKIDPVPTDGGLPDGAAVCDDATGDWDNDTIPNGEEGCLQARDTDKDGQADWQDLDSDNDKTPDAQEVGPKNAQNKCTTTKAPKDKWPCDTDGDGLSDYVDLDSDGDTIADKDEDPNGDGLLGCCLQSCGKTSSVQKANCVLTQDGCGSGQTCEAGKCLPAIGFNCSNGETNPRAVSTFDDGRRDSERGNFVCRDASDEQPDGRKPVRFEKSVEGDWHIAMEKSAKFNLLKIDGAGPKETAGVINMEDTSSEVAGFIVSRDTTLPTVKEEVDAILEELKGGKGVISARSEGAFRKTHDRYDAIDGVLIDIEMSQPSNVSTVRNELVATLLGRSIAKLGDLPVTFGSAHTQMVVKLIVVKRFEFKKGEGNKLELDEKGFPIDNGDQSKWRLVIMGAVAGRDNYGDPTRQTSINVEDLANGTGLAKADDLEAVECDVNNLSSLPAADVIWVIDESGSMSQERDSVVANATKFFSQALASGLDFRMGVTNVCGPKTQNCVQGKFCSRASTNVSDDGGTDRFLLPTEQSIFSACIKNPPGNEGGDEWGLANSREGVKRHLPRAANDPLKIRPDAQLVVIIVTDEIAVDLQGAIGSANYNKCPLPSSNLTQVTQGLQPFVDLFSGVSDPEAAAVVHLIGGTCSSTCSGAQKAHGYLGLAEATGGVVGDVCQKDLGDTLQIIIDDIIASASPTKLEYVPISASLAVAVDGKALTRSRIEGFDYRSQNNTLALINTPFEKGSEVIASYRRWKKQDSIDQTP